MSRTARAFLVLGGSIVALNAGLYLAGRATGGNGPEGPPSSSFTTAPDGLAAFADLLESSGHRVHRLREELSAGLLDPRTTLVVLDPEDVRARDVDALGRFVRRGGRLVAGGADPAWVREVVPAYWRDSGAHVVRPLAPAPESAIRSVRTAGAGSWTDTAGALPVLGADGNVLAAVASSGAGRVILLADPSPLQNRFLGEADNAAFALALAGEAGRPVMFAESVHGFGRAEGLGALPARWRVALLTAALAAAFAMLARGRRLGPPQLAAREFAPSRRRYVDALSATLARTKDVPTALAPLRAEVRRRILVRAGLPADAPDDELRSTAMQLGVDPTSLQETAEPLTVGRALARLSGREA